jgi:hypothetical protein
MFSLVVIVVAFSGGGLPGTFIATIYPKCGVVGRLITDTSGNEFRSKRLSEYLQPA